jgi:hypothetical protein
MERAVQDTQSAERNTGLAKKLNSSYDIYPHSSSSSTEKKSGGVVGSRRRQPRLERVVETETHQARSQVTERETERQKRKCFYVKILCVYTYTRDLDAVEMTLIYIL